MDTNPTYFWKCFRISGALVSLRPAPLVLPGDLAPKGAGDGDFRTGSADDAVNRGGSAEAEMASEIEIENGLGDPARPGLFGRPGLRLAFSAAGIFNLRPQARTLLSWTFLYVVSVKPSKARRDLK